MKFVGPLLILVCTVIWGSAFVAQKSGSEHFGPFTLTCYRNVLGGLFLWACIAVRDRRAAPRKSEGKPLVGGAISGLCLFLAMASQQIGIEDTTPGVSAFLTANYVLLVPILAWAVGKGRPSAAVCGGVLLSLAGTALICFPDFAAFASLRIGRGEAWTVLCAILFAVQIMAVDRFARETDVLRFSMIQLFASALFALPFVFLPSELSRAGWTHFVRGLPALLYVGVLSSGIAYTLQNLGQARTPPALAAIIMAMESVFGALCGWLFLNDLMTARQLVGCLLVLAAVVFSQLLPARPAKRQSV